MMNKLKIKAMDKLLIMVLAALLCHTPMSAQKTVIAKKNQKVFEVVEQMPEYPGGQVALFEFMMNNVKYPKDAEKKKVEGKVYMSFIVEPDGSISEVKPLKNVYPSLDAEGVRVISAMPKWKPGRQKGQLVRVHYVLPITFRLK